MILAVQGIYLFSTSEMNDLSSNSPFSTLSIIESLSAGFHIDESGFIDNGLGVHIKDAPIEDLNLSTRAYNCLYRQKRNELNSNHPFVMISDVARMSGDELSRIRNIGRMTVDEIIEKTEAYLLSKANTHEEVISSINNTIAPDYTVVDGTIVNLNTGRIVPDVKIEELGISIRAKNGLLKAGKESLSDVVPSSRQQLEHLPNVGMGTVSEIVTFIPAYLKANEIDHLISDDNKNDRLLHQEDNYSSSDWNTPVLASDYTVVKQKIYNKQSKKVVKNVPVDALLLSVRALNCLKRSGFMSIASLVGLPYAKFRQIKNLGLKTANEIQEILEEYLDDNQEIDTELSNGLNEAEFIPAPTIPFSEPDPDNPTLAPDYAVVKGEIYSRQYNCKIPNAPLSALILDPYTTRWLIKKDYITVASLVELPFQDIKRAISWSAAKDIQTSLETYLDPQLNSIINQESSEKPLDPSLVLQCFSEQEFIKKPFEEIADSIQEFDSNKIREAIEQLVETGELLEDEDGYSLFHQSFAQTIQSEEILSLLDERTIRVLRLRSSGVTLEEIGQEEGCTRERVRQIESKGFQRITKSQNRPFEEEKYAHIFTTYLLEKDFFFDYLGEPSTTWYYLNCRHRRGENNPALAIEDKAIPAEIRRAFVKYIHRGDVQINGVYIPAKRNDVINYVLERYCKDEIDADAFFDLYNQFLVDNDLNPENLQITEVSRPSWKNRLSESYRILWKQSQKLRYYDIEGTDFTELLEVLSLAQYQDIELSTRKFLFDYPEVMAQYDLRDEYEIHNLLKKIHAEKENRSIEFGRMPFIKFGMFNREYAVKKLLYALAPISQDDLAREIEKEYGAQIDTVKANWLSSINEYYHQGIYSIDYEGMPIEHLTKLKEILTDDFYYFSELHRIYFGYVPDADESLLSSFNLKRMGFLIGSSYVVQHYPTADAYFESTLTTDDVIDINPLRKRFASLTAFSGVLARLKHEKTIIEFEPYQYINIRRLEKMGFGKKELEQYGDRVWSYLVNDEFFSIRSLHKRGFDDELDMLGFGDMFYGSILKEDSRFSWQRVGGTVVFNPLAKQFSVREFLVDRINKEKAIDIDAFVSDLYDVYGVSFDKRTIIEKIKDSDVYYDPIMEKLYADYSTYFEEI